MSWPGGGHSPEPRSFFDLCFLDCTVHTHEGWSEADSASVGLEQDLSFCTQVKPSVDHIWGGKVIDALASPLLRMAHT